MRPEVEYKKLLSTHVPEDLPVRLNEAQKESLASVEAQLVLQLLFPAIMKAAEWVAGRSSEGVKVTEIPLTRSDMAALKVLYNQRARKQL